MSRRQNITLLLALHFILFPIFCAGEVKTFSLTHWEGLPSNAIMFVRQSEDGYVWIGTWHGLVRYDGHFLKQYNIFPEEMKGGEAICMEFLEAGDNGYWAVTSEGIVYFNTKTFQRKCYFLNESNYSPDCIDVSPTGTVFCTLGGLSVFDSYRGEFVPVEGFTGNVSKILCIGDNILLADNVKLTYVLNRDGIKIIESSRFSDEGITFQKRCGNYLIYTTDKEVKAFDCTENRNIGSCPLPFRESRYVIEYLGDNQAIIAYKNKAFQINFTDRSSQKLEHLENNSITSLCKDRQGLLWVGTDDSGISVYRDEDSLGKIVSDDYFPGYVTCLIEDNRGGIYCGSSIDGLFRLTGGIPEKCRKVNDKLHSNNIISIHKAEDNNMLVVTEKGLDVLDTESQRVQSLLGKHFFISTSFLDIEARRLYFGDLVGKLTAIDYDYDGKDYSVAGSLDFELPEPEYFANFKGRVCSIVKSPFSGKILVVRADMGLIELDPATMRWKKIDFFPEDSLPPVNSLYIASDSSLWALGNSCLCRIIPSEGKYKADTVFVPEGYECSFFSCQEDDIGRMWMGTDNGLACFDRASGQFNFYSDKDELQEKIFNGSCLKSSGGILFFGGTKGLNFFDPGKMSRRSFCPEISFSGLYVCQNPVVDFNSEKKIILKNSENFIRIEFCARDYIRNSSISYFYMLEGMDRQWTCIGNSNELNFTNIAPGHYKLKVKSTNGDGIICDNESELEFVVRPPLWRSPLALVLYAIMISLSVFCVLRFRRAVKTERRKKEKERQEKQMREEMMEAKLDFFTNVAHEFGTPLTMITGVSERLSEAGGLSAKLTEYVNVISKSAEEMNNMICELMQFRKVDSRQYKPNYSRVNLSEMLIVKLNEMKLADLEKNLKLITDVQPDLIQISDPSALDTIFTNLLSNAFKYTCRNGRIDVSLTAGNEGMAVFSVRNTGKGIRQEDMDRIFDRYALLDSYEREAEIHGIKRNGLGLALVKSLVEVLGGHIDVSSERGSFTQFTAYLPGADENLLESPQVDRDMIEMTSIVQAGGKAPTILFVDDDYQVSELVSDILSDNYNIICAKNGQDALDIMRCIRPDLIITDLMMPVMSGEELIKKLKSNEITRYIPVMLLTYKTDIESKVTNYRQGIEAYLEKPFHTKQLKALVDRILSSRVEMKKYYSSAVSKTEMFKDKTISTDEKAFIMKVIKIIEDNIENPDLTSNFVATSMCVGDMKFYRKIKALTDMTPGEYIRAVKLGYASNLLKTTDLTIQEIMYRAGFSNKSNFYKRFRERYGVTPKDYRHTSG